MKQDAIITLEVHTCGECGIHFGMPERFVKERREDGKTFHCPNGHPRVFREPEIERLKKEVAAAERKANQYQGWYKAEQSDHEHTRHRLSATKGVVTKTKKRIADGICPCCNKSFKVLAKHMAEKHPEYQHEDAD